MTTNGDILAQTTSRREAGGGCPSGYSWTGLTVDKDRLRLTWRHTNDCYDGRTGRWLDTEGSKLMTAAEIADDFGEEHEFTIAARAFEAEQTRAV